jgi:hypothetical protein
MSARSLLIGLIMTVPAFGLGPVWAFDPSSPAPVNVEKSGVGLKGYDPVAYFTNGGPVEGDPTITAVHDGTLYAFTSTDNRDAFIVEPSGTFPHTGASAPLPCPSARRWTSMSTLGRSLTASSMSRQARAPPRSGETTSPATSTKPTSIGRRL